MSYLIPLTFKSQSKCERDQDYILFNNGASLSQLQNMTFACPHRCVFQYSVCVHQGQKRVWFHPCMHIPTSK